MSHSRPSDPPEVLSAIASQAVWAARQGLDLNPAGTGLRHREAGIRGGIHPATRAELAAGAGGELGRIHSLRSSTALVLNVFQPWRDNPSGLSGFFGVKGATTLTFETKQTIWADGSSVRRTPPHLDVLLTGGGLAVAVESKFLEVYTPARNEFATSYFPADDTSLLWAGLPACRALAERINAGRESYTWLPVGQLLKHTLGLSTNQPGGFRLVFVWYRIDGPTADAIEVEIGRFARAISSEVDFTALTYQDLIARLKGNSPPTEGYFEYLEDRYQLGSEPHLQLPLITMATRDNVNHKTGLAKNIKGTQVGDLVDAYHRSIARAPQRPLAHKTFFGRHDGRGGAASSSREKVAAKAIYEGRPLTLAGESITVLDYEVPLRSRLADREIGEIDLLGIDTSRRLWVTELKIAPNTDTPLKALYQGLRYSAILDANRRTLDTEVRSRSGASSLRWPGVIALAADSAYWERWDHPKAGSWRSALQILVEQISAELGIHIVLVDLGNVETEVVDGAARLKAPVASQLVLDPPSGDSPSFGGPFAV